MAQALEGREIDGAAKKRRAHNDLSSIEGIWVLV